MFEQNEVGRIHKFHEWMFIHLFTESLYITKMAFCQ